MTNGSSPPYPVTPDGRYFLVRGRLWRTSNPALPADDRQRLVDALMTARRAVRSTKDDPARLATARAAVNAAKIGLGERGAPWWDDGAPDWNRRLVNGTPYADWAAALP